MHLKLKIWDILEINAKLNENFYCSIIQITCCFLIIYLQSLHLGNYKQMSSDKNDFLLRRLKKLLMVKTWLWNKGLMELVVN